MEVVYTLEQILILQDATAPHHFRSINVTHSMIPCNRSEDVV